MKKQLEIVDIPGYPDYGVSRDGNIWSRKRSLTHWLRMHPGLDKDGYVSACLHVDGRQRNVSVHVLVALTFLGPRPEQHETHHKRDPKTNNSVDNLEYKSKFLHQKDHKRRLEPEQVIEIRELIKQGRMTLDEMGKKFGVTGASIHCIKTGKNWSWLK